MIVAATSSGCRHCSRTSGGGGSGRLSSISVATIAGRIEVKRMPRPCSSSATARTKAFTPAFDAW